MCANAQYRHTLCLGFKRNRQNKTARTNVSSCRVMDARSWTKFNSLRVKIGGSRCVYAASASCLAFVLLGLFLEHVQEFQVSSVMSLAFTVCPVSCLARTLAWTCLTRAHSCLDTCLPMPCRSTQCHIAPCHCRAALPTLPITTLPTTWRANASAFPTH